MQGWVPLLRYLHGMDAGPDRPPLALLAGLVLLGSATIALGLYVMRGGPSAGPPLLLPPTLTSAPLPAPGEPLHEDWATAGRTLFRAHCAACHGFGGERLAGPDLAGVLERRDAAWVRAMILSPDSMLTTDPVAQGLLERWRVPMPDQGLDEPRARAVLEYLRSAPGSG